MCGILNWNKVKSFARESQKVKDNNFILYMHAWLENERVSLITCRVFNFSANETKTMIY